VSLLEQELLILPEHLISLAVVSGFSFTLSLVLYVCFVFEGEFEDTKEVIRIRISKKKKRPHNGQKKMNTGTNNDLQNKHIKLKIE
jgi:hypothetical protein